MHIAQKVALKNVKKSWKSLEKSIVPKTAQSIYIENNLKFMDLSVVFDLLTFATFAITLIYLVTRWKKFVNVLLSNKRSWKCVLFFITIGGIFEIVASEFGISLPGGIMADIRITIAVFFAIIGGPIVGISVGMIGGIYRLSGLFWGGFGGGLGYTFAPAGALAAIGAGLLGSWLYMRGVRISNLKNKSIIFTAVMVGIWTLIDIVLICPTTAIFFSEMSLSESFHFSTSTILLPMLISNVFAIVVILSIMKTLLLEEKKVRVLKELVNRYDKLVGPVAARIAKEVAEKENLPLSLLKKEEEDPSNDRNS